MESLGSFVLSYWMCNSGFNWASSFCFPGSSSGKESTCNAGDPGLISGLRRSTGEGIGYPLQYPWVSLVAQTVKNLPSMQETWICSLGPEDPLEKVTATYSSILAWRILRGHKESDMTEWFSLSLFIFCLIDLYVLMPIALCFNYCSIVI